MTDTDSKKVDVGFIIGTGQVLDGFVFTLGEDSRTLDKDSVLSEPRCVVVVGMVFAKVDLSVSMSWRLSWALPECNETYGLKCIL